MRTPLTLIVPVCVMLGLLLCLPVRTVYAQKTIHGRVYDTDSGEPLPIAHIRVEGRFSGTITNPAGHFELRIEELPADISVTYIGYHSEHRTITGAMPDSLDIGLRPNPVVLEEVLVTPEDPAVRIMREVIRRKQEWRAGLETYHAEGYTRVTLSNEEKIATIMESISDVYWDAERGIKEVVTSKRQAANFEGEDNFAQTRITPNLYDDDIDILGFDLIGLTHPDALDYYEFTLTGRRMRDDVAVFDIQATPKKKLQPSFVGTLSVLDEQFAVLDMEVKPNDAVMFPAPLNNISVAIEQQFDNFGGDYWLPVDVKFDGEIKLGLPGLKFPAIKFRQLTHLSGYEINTALPDSLFPETERQTSVSVNVSSNSASVTMDSRDVPVSENDDERREVRRRRQAAAQENAIMPAEETTAADVAASAEAEVARTDSIFAASPLVIPFTEEEAQAYAEIDSTDTLDKAFRPTGFLARLADEDDEPEEPKGPPSPFRQAMDRITEPFSVNASYNRVDGVSGGLGFEKRVHGVTVTLNGVHRDKPDDWAYGGGLRFQFGPGNRMFAAASFSTGTERQYGESVYFRWLNSLSTSFGRDDYFDYFDNRSIHAQAGYRFRQTAIEATGGIRVEKHSSRKLATSYNLLDRDIDQRPNPAVMEGWLRSVELSLSRGEGPEGLGLVGGNRVELRFEHSSPNLFDSEFDFTRAEIEIDGRLETFLRRRLFANVLDVKVIGSVSSGDLPPQRLGSIDGAFGVFAPFGVLRTLRNRPMLGEKYTAVFWEHNFRTAPFELVGLYWFARKGIGIIVHGASAKTWNEGALATGIAGDGEEHHEIGVSVNGLFTLFRIDVTRKLGDGGTYAGFGIGRLF